MSAHRLRTPGTLTTAILQQVRIANSDGILSTIAFSQRLPSVPALHHVWTPIPESLSSSCWYWRLDLLNVRQHPEPAPHREVTEWVDSYLSMIGSAEAGGGKDVIVIWLPATQPWVLRDFAHLSQPCCGDYYTEGNVKVPVLAGQTYVIVPLPAIRVPFSRMYGNAVTDNFPRRWPVTGFDGLYPCRDQGCPGLM